MQFTRSARKHRIGRGAALEAMVAAGVPILLDNGKWLWVGADRRGRELEIIGVPLDDEGIILVIHVMPTTFEKGQG
ncbi:hypothetical protein NY547_10310 [Cnuibacter physcomitrellae]|uniref:hypothetical protein n=1 Tax=Cnuibacter physcomitrellae TaxID=1619308 RepID=UPI002175E149|nr:hypothetical protein [Cnuibacter physcomitrellae]MCS5497629.1 hypothetical protein [Cnuibacter physcomitrellae]